MTDIDFPHLYWRSHRGMLELDQMLLPFIKARYESLNTDEKKVYARLLQEPDPEIFAWLLQGAEIKDKNNEYASLINAIKAFHQNVT